MPRQTKPSELVDQVIAAFLDAVDYDDPAVQDAIEKDNQRMIREAERTAAKPRRRK